MPPELLSLAPAVSVCSAQSLVEQRTSLVPGPRAAALRLLVAEVLVALPLGEVLGFENLVFSIFEFVHALLENSKFKSTVRKALPELIYYVILYMQITEEQVGLCWASTPGVLGTRQLVATDRQWGAASREAVGERCCCSPGRWGCWAFRTL